MNNHRPIPALTAVDDGLQEVHRAIAEHYERLSAGQRRVIDRLLSDGRYAAVVSAAELAREANVSESTVSRAAQTLGFAGFPDLQSRLRRSFVGATHEKFANVSDLGDTPEESAIRIMFEDAERVRSTAEDLSVDALRTATDMLTAAPRVFIFGARGSHGLAVMLSVGLGLVLPDVRLLHQHAGTLEDQLISLHESDVVVAISFRRIDRVMVNVVQHARQVGARILVVTDHLSSSAISRADLTLIAPVGPLRPTLSFAAAASLINALITSTFLRDPDATFARLQAAEEIWGTFDTFAER